MRLRSDLGSSCLFLVLLQGCKQPTQTSSQTVKPTDADAASGSTILTRITPDFQVRHQAEVGQTLEWRLAGSGKPEFWIFFGKNTPCVNGETTLHGSAGHPVSCVVGRRGSGTGPVQYSYELHKDPPPSGGFPDRVNPCIGCTD